MANPLVIVHGWSDDAGSFIELGLRLAAALGRQPEVINLADWVSLNDDVTFIDLAVAMERAWRQMPGHDQPRGHDVLVHSTGALVVREWMTRFYQPTNVPIKRFVQLAPANFGSPLAHQGRSIWGRIFKGGGFANGFRTGTQLLHGLELASPYTWELAERDLFVAAAMGGPWYGKGRVLATVFVGLKTYDGITGSFAGHGSDGTVRVSTANLKATRIKLDMGKNAPVTIDHAPEQIAMLPLEKFDHSSITKLSGQKPTAKAKALFQEMVVRIAEALGIDDDGWTQWCQLKQQEHDQIITWQHAKRDEHFQAYQNTVLRVRDEHGQPVSDYLLEVELDDKDQGFLSRFFQSSAIHHVHVHKKDPSHRVLYVNVTQWKKRIDREDEKIVIKVSASPEYRAGETIDGRRLDDKRDFSVGYQPAEIVIVPNQMDEYFAPNRTVLVDVILPRRIDAGIVRIDSLPVVRQGYGGTI